MDYIIIALWGLLTGGLIWGGSSNSTNADTPAAVTQLSMQGPSASSTKKIAPKESDKKAEKQARKAAKQAQKADKPAATGGIINYLNDKSNEPKHKAISFKNDKGDEEQRDTLVVYALKSDLGVVYTTDVEVANAAIEATKALEEAERQAARGQQAVETVAITEPLFEAEASALSNKRQDLRLPGQMKIDQLLCDEDGEPRLHILRRGESLTQIAQRYYADSSFWPYVFEVNRHQFSSPDRIQADMTLYLPDPAYYGINANDAQSVAKAKALVTKYLK